MDDRFRRFAACAFGGGLDLRADARSYLLASLRDYDLYLPSKQELKLQLEKIQRELAYRVGES